MGHPDIGLQWRRLHAARSGLGLGLAGALGIWAAGGWHWSLGSACAAAALLLAGVLSDASRQQRASAEHGAKAAFVAGTDRLGRDVLPVWSAQIENSRAHMEDAITTLTQHFLGIMERLRQLQHGAGEGAGRGLNGLFETSLELGSLVDAMEFTPEGEPVAQPLLDRCQGIALNLEMCAATLMHDSAMIQDDLGQALVQLQFQDRVSQRMMHVRHSIERIPAVLADKRRHFDSTGALEPVDTAALLAELLDSYSMAEEHAAHAASKPGAPQRDDAVTLF